MLDGGNSLYVLPSLLQLEDVVEVAQGADKQEVGCSLFILYLLGGGAERPLVRFYFPFRPQRLIPAF